jgi:hypothetical protein
MMAGARLQDANPVEVKIDPAKFDEYVGQYALTEILTVFFVLSATAKSFMCRLPIRTRIEIFPASETRFFLKVVPADGTFIRDASGKVTSLLWRQGGDEAKATRRAISRQGKQCRLRSP